MICTNISILVIAPIVSVHSWDKFLTNVSSNSTGMLNCEVRKRIDMCPELIVFWCKFPIPDAYFNINVLVQCIVVLSSFNLKAARTTRLL